MAPKCLDFPEMSGETVRSVLGSGMDPIVYTKTIVRIWAQLESELQLSWEESCNDGNIVISLQSVLAPVIIDYHTQHAK